MWFVAAIGAAFFFGLRGILYQWTSQRSIDRNLLFIGIYISSTILVLILNSILNQPWSKGIWFGLLMGIFSFLANTFSHKGYAVGRASVIAFFSSLTPVLVVLFAALLWGEALTPSQLTGFSIITLSLIIVRYRKDTQGGNKYRGWQFGFLSIIFYSFTDLSSKQSLLEEASILPVLTTMFATSTVLFSGAYFIKKSSLDSLEQESSPKPIQNDTYWTNFNILLLGTGIGLVNVLAMILKLVAFDSGVTGVVSSIIGLSIVVILLYARVHLKEAMTRTEISGVVIALIGVIVLKWVQ
ncbi:DMT family transporter [Paenibacillus xylanexedens]|uniref:DMT family transporter n=1 Tax=Paenibacillus xylanexedens TaxID=528191 RepID=UPI0011A856F0|nr:DMT family transporter [Paenibacillus xylanexedens]